MSMISGQFLSEVNMDWTTLVAGLALVMMIAFIAPRAVAMMQNSPKADGETWMKALIPIALVGGFVVFLMSAI